MLSAFIVLAQRKKSTEFGGERTDMVLTAYNVFPRCVKLSIWRPSESRMRWWNVRLMAFIELNRRIKANSFWSCFDLFCCRFYQMN